MAFTPYQLAQGMLPVPITVGRDDSKAVKSYSKGVQSYTFILICCGIVLERLWVKGLRQERREGIPGRGGVWERGSKQKDGAPPALAGGLAIITEGDGSGATSWQQSIIGSQNGAAQKLPVLLVTGHAHPHMVWQPHLQHIPHI